MIDARDRAAGWVAQGRAAWLVELAEVRGSAPRTAGTRMAVAADAVAGTIGGGHLELEAIRIAREALAAGRASHGPACDRTPGDASPPGAAPPAAFERRYALGPSLGQCCGGAVVLRFAPLDAAELERWPRVEPRFALQLHGAGHVGRAIARLLETLPCEVDWIDERDDEFAIARAERAQRGGYAEPAGRAFPAHLRATCVDAPAAEVALAPAGAFVLVLTHSHDLDFEIVEAALRRPDLGFVGLIGSATKRARFERRLRERGLAQAAIARLACPIGVDGIAGKEPEVIAIAVVAQLLQQADRRAAGAGRGD